ncbi:MAG: hypothetical protein Q9187_003433 [Circinaria calcarea]
MFTSTRPVSVLYLKGLEHDDPDLYPVSLPGQPQDLTKVQLSSRRTSWEQKPSAESTPTDSSLVSPSLSNQSLLSHSRSKEMSTIQKSTPLRLTNQLSSDWPVSADFTGLQDSRTMFNLPDVLSHTTKVPRGSIDGTLPDWIEALGVDSAYKPPPERLVKPVACFYVLVRVSGKTPVDGYYRAVYLMQRTVRDLIHSIAAKCEVDCNRVQRVLRINSKGLKIMVDDEVVRELPESQDMSVEFAEVDSDGPMKQEPGPVSGSASLPEQFVPNAFLKAMEMRLIF